MEAGLEKDVSLSRSWIDKRMLKTKFTMTIIRSIKVVHVYEYER